MVIAGVDEAGVGCLAGPIVLVAAAFDEEVELPKLVRDSKSLKAHQHEMLIDEIYEAAEFVIISVAHADFINTRQNIWKVWDELMPEVLLAARTLGSDQIIVDGTRTSSVSAGTKVSPSFIKYEAHADANYREVSAASIVAKYVQVMAMEDLHDQFPRFGFNNHHGYGTKEHKKALAAFGPVSAHRIGYKPVKKVLDSFRKKNPGWGDKLLQLDLTATRSWKVIDLKLDRLYR